MYHQGWFIGKLPARGKPPTKENTQDVYDWEYEEVVSRIKNTLDLDLLSSREFLVPYNLIPCSIKNPDIILHPEEFAKRQAIPPPDPGRGRPARDYNVDGIVGLVDVSWTQRILSVVEDEIDKDPCYYQYPYQEGDEDDGEEDMDVEEQDAGACGCRAERDVCCHWPGAEYELDGESSTPGATPQSTHTDTDAVAEFDTLQVGTP